MTCRLCVELDGRRDGVRGAAWAALEQAVIGKAVDLLSGPGGLASFLRRRQLGARFSGTSLPLDMRLLRDHPDRVQRRTLRDRHCRWSGAGTARRRVRYTIRSTRPTAGKRP